MGEPPAPRETSIFWTAFIWNQVFWCLFWGAIVTIVIGGPARLFGDHHGRVANWIVIRAFRLITLPLFRHRVTVTGLENLPPGGGILCPNHQSLSDLVYLFRIPFPFKVVTKKEMAQIPIVGSAIRLAGFPVVDRGDPDSAQRFLERCTRYLAAGLWVLSFPEGTRSRDGEVKRLNSGTARLAIATHAPLVPVGLAGTYEMLPATSLRFSARTKLRIHIGEPIATDDLGRGDVRRLTRELREAMRRAKAVAGSTP